MATEYFNDAWRIPNNKNQSLVSNYSMEFDGTSDFVTISNPTELTDDFTIAAWIYPTRVDDSYEMIYTQGDGTVPAYFAVQDTKLHVYITGIYQTNLGFINANEWQHVAVTRTSGVLNLYKNGVEYNGNRPTQNGTVNNNSDGVIGKWYNSSHYFKGKIDQVCIFDYSLPATGTNSIATLYGGGTAVTNPMSLSPKPVAYYQLGDQTASNDTTKPTPPVQSYLVPNNSLQDYVFNFIPNDYINAGTGLGNSLGTYTGDASISLWFKADTTTDNDGLFSMTTFASNAYGNLWISITSNVLYFVGSAIQGYKYIPFTDTTSWHHLVCIFKSGDIANSKIYLDGIDQITNSIGTFPSSLSMTGKKTIIGGYYGTSNTFDGELSNVSFFNTGLENSDVQTLYNNGTPGDISSLNPVSWWKLNAQDTFDGTNWTIKDYAGSNDGASFGMTSANLVQSNLQHTSGYSPYALSLDGINDYLKLNNTLNNSILFGQTSFTISAWIYLSSINTPVNNPVISNLGNNTARQNYMLRVTKLRNIVASVITTTGSFTTLPVNGSFEFDKWEHITITLENQELKCYLNGRQVGSTITNVSGSVVNSVGEGYIGARGTGVTTQVFGGNLSNIAVWQGSAQNPVTLYNNGVPGDLTSLNPSAWWQLGSNSSFDTNWTCLNEGSLTGLDAVSFNMVNDDIVNGPGYSASGLGTSSIEIIGDAPYSTANGISENMDVLDRTTDVPS